MRHKGLSFIFLIGIFLLASPSFAQIPSPLKNIQVSSTVTLDKTTGIYEYRYSLFNPPVNDGKIFIFQIDIAKPLNGQELSSKGLEIQRGINIRGKVMIWSFEEEVTKIKEILRKPVIPVGAVPPSGYPFPGWTVDITVMGTVSWGGSEQSLILPNQTLGGFILTSRGLPGIREMQVQPDYIASEEDVLKMGFTENEYIEHTGEVLDKVYKRLTFTSKTIGPTAPPADFKPIAFLNYIIDLKHQAVSLGWITNKGIENSLDVKLDNAKKKLEQGNIIAAKNILEAFINEVEAQNGKHLTPEAYGLLKYNAQYLIDKL